MIVLNIIKILLFSLLTMIAQGLIFAFAFKVIETSILNFSIFNLGKVILIGSIASGIYFGLPLAIANSNSKKLQLNYAITIIAYLALILYSIFSNKLKFDDLFNVISSTYLLLSLLILLIGRFTHPRTTID